MGKKYLILTSSLLLTLVIGCKKPAEKDPLNVPSVYDGTNFAANTATENAVLTQLIALTDEAKKGRTAANSVASSELLSLYEAGNPSLSSVTSNYYKGILTQSGGWFDVLAAASGKTWNPGDATNGGVYGGYLFNGKGVEPEQIIEKGLFQAALYNHAVNLTNGALDATTADKLVAIFGAKPAFANSGSTNVAVENRDRAVANYGARRDKNDGNGLYTQIKTAFITLQAAIKAGSDYNEERDKAIADIQLLWEKIIAGTVINYCHSPIEKLSATNPTDADKAAALHAIGEGIGFIHGFKTINTGKRKITDAQIDEILTLFNAPASGEANTYRFATEPTAELNKLQEVITKLKGIYGFSDAEIEDFKSNWVSVQGR